MAGVRGLRIKQKKLQRAARVLQHEMYSSSVSSPPLPTLGSITYPSIFLSPASSSYDNFSPSPSPLPAVAGSDHHQLAAAAIIGGSIASVVALAATTTIIATVAGKAGLACLLGPLCKLLPCLGGKLLGTTCTDRLKSLWETLKKWLPARKRRRSSEAADDIKEGSADGDGNLIFEILGGSHMSRASENVEQTAAAPAHLLTTSSIQNLEQLQTSANAYIVTAVSDLVESEVKKKKEEMMQPLQQSIGNARGYAESLLSAADTIIDDLRPLGDDEVCKLKAKANYVKSSTEALAAMQTQPSDTVLVMFDQAIEAEDVEEVSKRSKLTSEKLQGTVLLEEEQVVLHRRRGKAAISSTHKIGGADEMEDEELRQRVLLNEVGKENESASDATTTKILILEGKHKQNISGAATAATHLSSALVPSSDKGGGATNNKIGNGTMIAMPKEIVACMEGKTMTSSTKGKLDENNVLKNESKHNHKRASNLGHVSFSCEMSTQRLRFFTSCKFGAAYGSPTTSPNQTPTQNSNTHYH